MTYVYKFLNTEGKIIYIGKTVNIKSRMQQHFSKGHLPAECYRSVARIEYKKYKTEADALIMETYYITKHTPQYNKLQQSRDFPTLEINESNKWRIYKEFKPIQVTDLSNKVSKKFRYTLAAINILIFIVYLMFETFI